ncbi:hypothetical protein INR49_022742 [Caranx melampygus]|nr:hypothetical protein INR49_022742 [Caranx melampygus]
MEPLRCRTQGFVWADRRRCGSDGGNQLCSDLHLQQPPPCLPPPAPLPPLFLFLLLLIILFLSSSFSSFSSPCPSTKSASQSSGGGGGGGFVSMATASSVPVAAVPGNTYYPPQPTSSPSPSLSSASSLDQSSGHATSVCVCSSCGCRGNCGTYGALPGYAAAGYLQPFSAGPSLFTLGPLLHLSPCWPLRAAPAPEPHPLLPHDDASALYRHSPVSHDQQQGFSFYHPHGSMGNGGQKRAAASLSCITVVPTDTEQRTANSRPWIQHSKGRSG